MSIRPGPSLMTASPASGWWSSTTRATSPRRSGLPPVSSMATWERSSAVVMGRMCWIPTRWLEVSMNPPVPGVEASTKLSGDTHSAFPVVLMTWLSETSRCRSFSGSTCTCSCRSRCPQMATLATPDTPIRRGLIFQRARTDMSIRDRSLEESPTTMTLLVDDRGWSMTGAFETFGIPPGAWISRSCTSCRARRTSVPGSKMSSIRDSPGSDSERICSSHATPLSRSCSSGTVTSCSTSAAESPRASVWMSTSGGVNSGSTSTGMPRSWMRPRSSSAAAIGTTRDRSFRLDPTIQRIIAGDLPPKAASPAHRP